MDNIIYTNLPLTDFLQANQDFTGKVATTYGGFLVNIENGTVTYSERVIDYHLTDYIKGTAPLDSVTFQDSSGRYYTINRGVAQYTIPHAIVVPEKLLNTLDLINPYVGAYIWDCSTDDYTTKSFINPVTIEELKRVIKDKGYNV